MKTYINKASSKLINKEYLKLFRKELDKRTDLKNKALIKQFYSKTMGMDSFGKYYYKYKENEDLFEN